MTLEQRKYHLIQEIISIGRVEVIELLDQLVKKVASVEPSYQIELGNHEGLATSVDLEQLERERPIKPLDMEAFFKETEHIIWDKSVEELLGGLDR